MAHGAGKEKSNQYTQKITMSKIGIIGLGYVGRAVAQFYTMDRLVISDPALGHEVDYNEFSACEYVFVCVPSPMSGDGSCDSDILKSVLERLAPVLDSKTTVISKTTAPPSVYLSLQEKYPNIVHCPEFLTAANSYSDYMNSEYCVIGGDRDRCLHASNEIISQIDLALTKFVFTDIATASMYKYLMNSYLAAKVTFMNDFYKLAVHHVIDWSEVCSIAKLDSRIGDSHMMVPGPDGKFGWGGACFPKDVAAIIAEAKSLDVDFKLLESVKAINQKHRNINDQSV
jgi:UDPglucose 6-dehydrogenase